MSYDEKHLEEFGIAIIGISCRFPGAKNIEEYWHNIANGLESISFFSKEELIARGIAKNILDNPNFVPAGGIFEEHDQFDAGFFNLLPREVEILDPQQRLFLETAWEAWEDAGYTTDYYQGSVGVFGGTTMNTYLMEYVLKNPDIMDIAGYLQLMIGNDKDFVTTRVSHKLRLTGPSYAIQTACSTSLVAIHHACISLLAGECDMALAGGSSVRYPHASGYLYFNGGTSSIDGHCRAFDKDATGSVVGNGAGMVVLKPFAKALADHDHIYGVILGSATGNDGADKPSYSTPSEKGQARVLVGALRAAGVEASDIDCIEAHGTATYIGDPIEFSALNKAFHLMSSSEQKEKNYCALGSVKSNIGHLDAAAGVSGLIKVIMALQNKLLPPQINFTEINPKIDIDDSPFYVNTTLKEWPTKLGKPRLAGITSIGLGGANAHVVLQEAPEQKISRSAAKTDALQIIPLSARTATSLESYKKKLLDFLKNKPDLVIEDIAFTLQVGRQSFEHRETFLASSTYELIEVLKNNNANKNTISLFNNTPPKIIFMFPGQGSQYPKMFKRFYYENNFFKKEFDHCNAIYKNVSGTDLVDFLLDDEQGQEEKLSQTYYLQPMLFIVEYAMAKVFQKFGIEAITLIGHSLGEFVAATLAGVFSLEDALLLIHNRAVLSQSCETGLMISALISKNQAQEFLSEEIELAAVNSGQQVVFSGSKKNIQKLCKKLKADNIAFKELSTSHAFHSKLMSNAATNLLVVLQKINLNKPIKEFISNDTGNFITLAEATNPEYWANHIVQTVNFYDGLTTLYNKYPDALYLEVGPNNVLANFVLQAGSSVTPLVMGGVHHQDGQKYFLDVLSKLWLSGVKINWPLLHKNTVGRISLPTTQFEKKKYFLKVPHCAQKLESINVVNNNSPTQEKVIMENFEKNVGLHSIFNDLIESLSDREINIYISPRGQKRPKQEVTANQSIPCEQVSGAWQAPVPAVVSSAIQKTHKQDDVKAAIKLIWLELLGVEVIDESKTINELGAHSLLLTQLLVRLNKQYNTDISLQQLLDNPTLQQMTTLVTEKIGMPSTSSGGPLFDKVKNILEGALGIFSIDANKDIYQMGAHSMLVTQILAQINKEFGYNLMINEFAKNRTLNEMVKFIETKTVSASHELDDLLNQLQGLSEQEINEILLEAEKNG